MSSRTPPTSDRAAWRDAVLDRDRRCVRCATERGLEAHHRLMRSQGGPDTPENGVALCGPCHRWVHAHPRAAYDAGLLRTSWQGPPRLPYRPRPALPKFSELPPQG